MTVHELIELLSQYPSGLEVRFSDTYQRTEGWESGHETATCAIAEVHFDVAECCVVLEEDF